MVEISYGAAEPEREDTAGPWALTWYVKNLGPPWDPRTLMGVAACCTHRETGERRRHAVRINLDDKSDDDAEVATRVVQAKNLLRAWAKELNST